MICRIPQTEVAYCNGLDPKVLSDPGGDCRRQWVIDPDYHATSKGWSNLRAAYNSAACKSSITRSGISSRI